MNKRERDSNKTEANRNGRETRSTVIFSLEGFHQFHRMKPCNACVSVFLFSLSIVVCSIVNFGFFLFFYFNLCLVFIAYHFSFNFRAYLMNDFRVNGNNYFWCYFCDTVDYVENLLLCNCRQYLEFFFVIANRGCSWEMVCCVSLAWIIHDSIPFI